MSVLELDDVTVAFDGHEVLCGISGRVEEGQAVALIGPNGAGKSTLIRAVLGLVPVRDGAIRVLGTDPAHARRHVGYVPQYSRLDPEFPVTALQVVLMGRYRSVGWLRRPGRTDRARALEALDAVGLADRARDRFGTLSGGQRQRVLFARALAQGAHLLVLDEPFNGVDTTTQDELVALLAAERSRGVAVLLSTHDLDVARHACDETCLLNRRQFAFGPTAKVLEDDLLLAAFAGGVHLVGDDVVGIGAPHHHLHGRHDPSESHG